MIKNVFFTFFQNWYFRLCLLRRASAIAHYHTPFNGLGSVIFSMPKLGKIVHNYTKCTPTAHLNMLISAICSTAGMFEREGLVPTTQ